MTIFRHCFHFLFNTETKPVFRGERRRKTNGVVSDRIVVCRSEETTVRSDGKRRGINRAEAMETMVFNKRCVVKWFIVNCLYACFRVFDNISTSSPPDFAVFRQGKGAYVKETGNRRKKQKENDVFNKCRFGNLFISNVLRTCFSGFRHDIDKLSFEFHGVFARKKRPVRKRDEKMEKNSRENGFL